MNQHHLTGDEPARERIRSSLDESLIVEAAAGTGKTTALVSRLVALFQTGRATPEGVAAVTFTRRAAGELKLRLRREMDLARRKTSNQAERQHLSSAIARLEEAHIGTIHSFCGELLRERPAEAAVDPNFVELDGVEAEALLETEFAPWIREKLDEMPESFSRLLARSFVITGGTQAAPLEKIRAAAWKFLEWRDFTREWEMRPFDRRTEMDRLVEEAFRLLGRLEDSREAGGGSSLGLGPLRDLVTWIQRAELERPRDYSQIEAFLVDLPDFVRRQADSKAGRRRGHAEPSLLTVDRDRLLEDIERFRERANAELAVLLQREFRGLARRYEEAKQRAGRLDFVDLLIRARELLQSHGDVRQHFQSRFSHIFVDEFQDTDPLQAEILLLLAADDPACTTWESSTPVPGKLFLVGDPKQSIYRFRRADVELYERIKQQLLQRNVGLVYLTRNFRSQPPILHMTNAAFESEMGSGDHRRGQAAYVPLDPVRAVWTDQPVVLALPVPRPYGRRSVSNIAIEESLPAAVAAFIAWLLESSGWQIGDPVVPGERGPIRPGHIAILFRRFVSWGRDVTRSYARELETRGIPHVLIGSRSFYDREEVETVRAALTAIEWPGDELAVYAALRGSLFSVPDRLLLWFRESWGSLDPLRTDWPHVEVPLQPIVEALRFLGTLHHRRNRRPYAGTMAELLEFTRAHAGFVLRPAGQQVLANVQRVSEMARAYERAGGTSFRGFVQHLESGAEYQRAESPVLEEGVDGVRLTTVHAAKGLEFPVVILADMTCRTSMSRPDRHVDPSRNLAAFSLLGCRPWELIENEELEAERDEAEALRVAYVAATRARDLLVVPAVGDEVREGWLGAVNKALYPAEAERREPRIAPGCPRFGPSSVLDRPVYFDGMSDHSVAPGLHRPQWGNHEVVWFDPAILDLNVPLNFGLRQEELLAAGTEGREDGGLERYREWESRRREVLRDGAREHLTVRIVSSRLSQAEPPDAAEVKIARLERREGQPDGRRFGTLLHAILREIRFEAAGADIEALSWLHGRLLGATPEEVSAAAGSAGRALESPLLRRAFEAEVCRREWPVLLRLGNNELLDGVVDLLFKEAAGWIVVDFKTDLAITTPQPDYVRQVQWYVHAVRQLTGSQVEGWLLGV
ncbi:MAG: UvrD-helicase domain-containing protein [Acidobacteriota bacterium]